MKAIIVFLLFVSIVASFKLRNASKRSNIFEGDMMLTSDVKSLLFSDTDNEEESFGVRNAVADTSLQWPGGLVYYQVDSSIPFAQRNLLSRALRNIEAHTCVRFINGVSPSNHALRVTNNGTGCWSYIGYRRLRQQQLNLERNGCWFEDTIMHEFLHAIGFFHQQSSYERDDYVNIHLENVIPGLEHNFNKYTNKKVTNFDTEYDYNSIMHYDSHLFSKNGRPTMTPKFPRGAKMGTSTKLSETDILKINRLYDC